MIWNSDLVETMEFDNLIVQAVVTMDGASQPHGIARRACPRGLFRARRQDLDEAHARDHRSQAKTISIDYRPVHSYTMSNDMQYIEPKARVY